MTDNPMQGRVAFVPGPAGASAPSPLRRSRRLARRSCWAPGTSAPWNPWRATSRPGGQALAVQADMTDVDSMRALVGRAVTAYGRLDVAIQQASAA